MISTQDFGLVAGLMLHGVRPGRSIREGSRLVFQYEPSPQLDELRAAYESDTLLVPASSHAALIKTLAIRAREAR